MPKIWSAKVGTIPMLIVLRYNYKLKIGKTVLWRKEGSGEKYHQGRIEDIAYKDNEPIWIRLSRR